MNIEFKQVGKLIILIPKTAKIDSIVAAELKSTFMNFLSAGNKYFLLDLSDVQFMDSAGLGMLVTVGQRLLLTNQGELSFCNIPKSILNAFDLTHLDRIFTIYENDKVAIQAITFKALNQKNLIYLGKNLLIAEMLQKLAGNRSNFEIMTTVDPLQKILKESHCEGLLIEESFLDSDFKELLTQYESLRINPLILLANFPCPISHRKEIKERFDIIHVLELPFEQDEGRFLVYELIEHQSKGKSKELSLSEQLFNKYTESILAKLEEIEDLVKIVKARPERDAIDDLRDEIHKISGSAGSYGYFKAGESCKNLEELLHSALEKNQFDVKLLKEIETHVRKIDFYFNATLDKNLAQKNVAVQPVSEGSVYVLSNDLSVCELINSLAASMHLTLKIESSSENAIENLAKLDFKPQIVFVDNFFHGSSVNGLDLIESIKSSLLAREMHFCLVVEDESLEVNVKAASEGVNFILKKPLSYKMVEDLFKKLLKQHHPQPYKILIVDDDVDICNYFKTTICNHNILVETLSDETKILKSLFDFKPHLLILDINLPNFNGWTLLKTLRSDIRYQNLKIIIITSTNDLKSLKESHTDYDDIWTKPLDKNFLLNNLLKLVDEHFSRVPQEHRFATFLSAEEFEKSLRRILSAFSDPTVHCHLVVIGTNDFKAIAEGGLGAQEESLIACENLINRLLKEDNGRGYLENGRFGFLFSNLDLNELEKRVASFLAESEFQICIQTKAEDIFSSFASCIVTFLPAQVHVNELLRYALHTYEKEIKPGITLFTTTFIPVASNKEPAKM